MIMTKCRDRRIVRLALTVVMALSLLLAPIVDHGPSHDLTASDLFEVERHSVSAVMNNDSDHGHDHAWPKESQAGHSHEHNPADHSHDVPVSSDVVGHAISAVSRSWRTAYHFHDPAPPFGIKRPPRS